MTAARPLETDALQLEPIRQVLKSKGPCVTVYLPAYHPGEPAGTPGAFLKANLQNVTSQLTERKFAKVLIDDLVSPLQHFADEPASAAGSRDGSVIFRSPDAFQQFHLTQPVKASATVAGCFAIRPLLRELNLPPAFFVLNLTKKGVTLLRCSGLDSSVAVLPPSVPATLEEALALEPPDHDLENRSVSGPSTGAMRGVHFGTGSGRETQRAHLSDYYKLVDRGIHKMLQELPLVLAGPEEDVGLFRSVSGYSHLATGALHGNNGFAQASLRQAYALLEADAARHEAKAVLNARERTDPSRFSTDPDAIVHAAFEGRVGELYLAETAEKLDVFERGAYRSSGKEDLLNLAAVQTLAHRGKAFILPAEMMPEGAIAAAVFRF